MEQKIAKGQKFGDWTLKKCLGGGGNGFVWKAINSQGQEAAIKLLKNIERKPYARFKNEIDVITKNPDIEGILPILDSRLPSNIDAEIPWYVMPIAEPIYKHLDGKYFEDVIQVITEISKTLTELHSRNIAHRDIKPENLLAKDGKFYLGDFGLVEYPDKIELTSEGDRIGANSTIAPEMRRDADKADGKPADVYSLAKTLWILLTKNKKGFDGQYFADGANGFKNSRIFFRPEDFPYFRSEEERKLEFTKPLDDLLFASTNDDPSSRPSMAQFLQNIAKIASDISDIFLMWRAIQRQLFPMFTPARAIWENTDDIVHILNLLCSYKINHMLYPEGGDADLQKSVLGKEPDTVELVGGAGLFELVKPKRLVFESFDNDLDWSYFLLETGGLEPTGLDTITGNYEELAELEPLHYIQRFYLDQGTYNDDELPSSARVLIRYFKGTFLITQRISAYSGFDTYRGLHNQMTTDEFRDYVLSKWHTYKQITTDPEIEKIALERNTTPHDFAVSYLKEEARQELLDNLAQDRDSFPDQKT